MVINGYHHELYFTGLDGRQIKGDEDRKDNYRPSKTGKTDYEIEVEFSRNDIT